MIDGLYSDLMNLSNDLLGAHSDIERCERAIRSAVWARRRLATMKDDCLPDDVVPMIVEVHDGVLLLLRTARDTLGKIRIGAYGCADGEVGLRQAAARLRDAEVGRKPDDLVCGLIGLCEVLHEIAYQLSQRSTA